MNIWGICQGVVCYSLVFWEKTCEGLVSSYPFKHWEIPHPPKARHLVYPFQHFTTHHATDTVPHATCCGANFAREKRESVTLPAHVK